MATSYAAGRLAQLKSGGFEYWMYRHSDAVARPRPLHVSWNGLTLPANDPWWQSHYPPNGWGCQCYVVGVSRAAGERLGGRFGQAPDDGFEPDGRPKGIDKGWDYMPGRKALAKKEITKLLAKHDPILADMSVSMAEKTRQWQYELAKAFMQSLPEAARDAVAISYRALPSVADDVGNYAQAAIAGRPVSQYLTLGLLTSNDVRSVMELKSVDAAGFDFALERPAVMHTYKQHGDIKVEVSRGQRAVTAEDYKKLPEILSTPDSIEDSGVSRMTGRPLMKWIKWYGDEEWVFVVEVRSGRKMLVQETLYIRNRTRP